MLNSKYIFTTILDFDKKWYIDFAMLLLATKKNNFVHVLFVTDWSTFTQVVMELII